jgi:hypothetical protein
VARPGVPHVGRATVAGRLLSGATAAAGGQGPIVAAIGAHRRSGARCAGDPRDSTSARASHRDGSGARMPAAHPPAVTRQATWGGGTGGGSEPRGESRPVPSAIAAGVAVPGTAASARRIGSHWGWMRAAPTRGAQSAARQAGVPAGIPSSTPGRLQQQPPGRIAQHALGAVAGAPRHPAAWGATLNAARLKARSAATRLPSHRGGRSSRRGTGTGDMGAAPREGPSYMNPVGAGGRNLAPCRGPHACMGRVVPLSSAFHFPCHSLLRHAGPHVRKG